MNGKHSITDNAYPCIKCKSGCLDVLPYLSFVPNKYYESTGKPWFSQAIDNIKKKISSSLHPSIHTVLKA